MATTTTNYGFDIPQSTDLVKDGATAIATLGQDIDTAMNTALGTKKAGMVLLNTTSFSGVASQSFNNVFSTTYDNYKLIISDITTVTAAADIRLRFRVSGSDNSTASSYLRRGFYSDSSSLQNTFNSENSLNLMVYSSITANKNSATSGDIMSPFVATRTNYNFISWSGEAEASAGCIGYHTQTVSYDGFTIYTSTGNNFTAKVQVFGYNK